MKKTYNDFKKLIEDSDLNGYRVCLARSTMEKEMWSAREYIDYIIDLEYYKFDNVSISYDFIYDQDNRVISVETIIHFPEKEDNPEKFHSLYWVVEYKK